MIKLKKNIIITVFLVLLISISGCKIGGKKDTQKALEEIRTGTEGIALNFLPNAPPAKIVVEQGAPPETHVFDVVLDIRNKGAFPQPEDVTEGLNLGKIFLSGYDPNIIKFKSKDPNPGILNVRNLEGKSTINPNGGQDILTFSGELDINRLNV
ncbi:hypothetical protein HYX03_04590 [Candidatus Woesearchaeota archaeon]|nr:hypothetical protein [Candidatus Woesearchaeota archaeon]